MTKLTCVILGSVVLAACGDAQTHNPSDEEQLQTGEVPSALLEKQTDRPDPGKHGDEYIPVDVQKAPGRTGDPVQATLSETDAAHIGVGSDESVGEAFGVKEKHGREDTGVAKGRFSPELFKLISERKGAMK